MSKLWCKLWNFVLNTFTSAIELVGTLLETVGTVLVDVLGAVAESVGNALGFSGSTILLLGLGALVYFAITGDKDKPKSEVRQELPTGAIPYGY